MGAGQQKEDKLFDEMYIRYFPKLVRFATNYLVDKTLAENAVQDVFLKLFEHQEIIPFDGNLQIWLFIIIKNKCLDYLRSRKKYGKLLNIDQTCLDVMYESLASFDEKKFSEEDLEEVLERAINSLPGRCREIFVKCKIEGMSYKEVSDTLGISVNTVEGQMSIALRKLRFALKDFLPLFIFII